LKVLFFARKNDELSSKCLKHLLGLGFEVNTILSSKRGEKFPDDCGRDSYDYIFCFRSYFIIPKSILTSTRYYNINFHPGSPKYPGSGGLNLTLFNKDKEFGVTAHSMDEKIDSGDIIEYRSFKVNEFDNIMSLLDRTHNYLFCLFVELTTKIREEGEKFIKDKIKKNTVNWSKDVTKISEINKFQIIEKNISELELSKRIRSFNHPSFPLEIYIHNYRFIYKEKI
jgi:methionyl-tRNA formyltransferase